MSARDVQEGGTHYTSKGVQPWDAMEAWMPRDAFIGFLEGNVIKYMARWREKGGAQDLAKAAHYLARMREAVEREA